MRKRMSRATSASKKRPAHLDEADILDIYDGEDAEDFRASGRGKSAKPLYNTAEEVFKCRHCRRFVCPLPSGGHHRNHCPFCLYSRHVDDRQSGDRLSTCGASMQPIGRFQRPGERMSLYIAAWVVTLSALIALLPTMTMIWC
ncbi:RNHCP domain-containing protein [Ktedonospora formicarum]|uniref:RNHCP domain-containing protein n=1 Tax=Ktedonospora formicarum TaxID=2778364 RepID=UPI001C68DD93|nr:RNHCP domain-containing protein [Ktedonospora formicarum]